MKLFDVFRKKQNRRSYKTSTAGIREYRNLLDVEERAFNRYMRMRQMILDEVRELRGEDSFDKTIENIRRLREVEAELGNGKESHWWEALAQIAAVMLTGQGSGLNQHHPSLPAIPSKAGNGSPEQPVAAPPIKPQESERPTPAAQTPSDTDVALMAWQFVLADAIAADIDVDLIADMLIARTESDDAMRQIIAQLLATDTKKLLEYLKRFKPTLDDSAATRIEMLKHALQGEFA